jgi:hypothetical protein
MLEFFRTYQKYFFIVITAVVVASFSFFGTYSAIQDNVKREDAQVATAVDGSPLMLSAIQQLSRFISSDRDDLLQQTADSIPNLCNDGVIRYDLIRTGLADLLALSYFDSLKEELSAKVEKAKRFRPYAHPEAPYLSAKVVWDRFLPAMSREADAFRETQEVTPKTFSRLARLYGQQGYFSPEAMRRILLFQCQQIPNLRVDPRLQNGDLSLLGFHTSTDWFGRDFLDLSSEFILNAAAEAEKKGYAVSLEEAKGDLIRNFQVSLDKLTAAGHPKADLTLAQHLRMIGFDEQSAAETWRKVLLFRRYFQGVSQSAFVDRLPYRDFASYALETAVAVRYGWSPELRLKNFNDLIDFQSYLAAIAKPSKDSLALPNELYSLSQVEANHPSLVETSYRGKVSEVHLAEIGLKASVKEVWDWELDESHWAELRKKFSFLGASDTRGGRFQILEKLKAKDRFELDSYARSELVQLHPEWIDAALGAEEPSTTTIVFSTVRNPLSGITEGQAFESLLEKASQQDPDAKLALLNYSDDGKTVYRIENVELVAPKSIATFARARAGGLLKPVVEKMLEEEYKKMRASHPDEYKNKEGKWKPIAEVKETVAKRLFSDVILAISSLEKREWTLDSYAGARLLAPSRKAYEDLKKDPSDSKWLKGEGSPLVQQFKLVKEEQKIQRTANEEWMKQAFIMMPDQWSPISAPPSGDIVFFYLQEKKSHESPILDQIVFGKEMIAADAQRFLAEKLLSKAKKNRSIVIPVQGEKE